MPTETTAHTPAAILANGFHFKRIHKRSNFDKNHTEVTLLGTLGDFSMVRVEVAGKNSATVLEVKDLIASAPDMLARIAELEAALKLIEIINDESASDCRKRMGTRRGNSLVAARAALKPATP